jgi:hypothetical protein
VQMSHCTNYVRITGPGTFDYGVHCLALLRAQYGDGKIPCVVDHKMSTFELKYVGKPFTHRRMVKTFGGPGPKGPTIECKWVAPSQHLGHGYWRIDSSGVHTDAWTESLNDFVGDEYDLLPSVRLLSFLQEWDLPTGPL